MQILPVTACKKLYYFPLSGVPMQREMFLPPGLAPKPHNTRRHPDPNARARGRRCPQGLLRAHQTRTHLTPIFREWRPNLQERVQRHGGTRMRL